MNTKICPLMGGQPCQYTDCALYNKDAALCSISVIAQELQSASADTCSMAESLTEIGNELPGLTAAVKGLT